VLNTNVDKAALAIGHWVPIVVNRI
jgi:hypothetical protein